MTATASPLSDEEWMTFFPGLVAGLGVSEETALLRGIARIAVRLCPMCPLDRREECETCGPLRETMRRMNIPL